MNVLNYGIPIAVSTGFDMIAFTSLTMTFTKPSGAQLVVTNPAVTVPGVDYNFPAPAGLFLANKYAQYVTQPGDINEVGQWSVRVTYVDLNEKLTSDVAFFDIEP